MIKYDTTHLFPEVVDEIIRCFPTAVAEYKYFWTSDHNGHEGLDRLPLWVTFATEEDSIVAKLKWNLRQLEDRFHEPTTKPGIARS